MQTISPAAPSAAEPTFEFASGRDRMTIESDVETQARSFQLTALGEMTAAMAHEGRSLLQLAEANLELLADQISAQPDALLHLDRARGAHHLLRRLFDDIRQVAAPMSLAPEWCNLARLALETAQELSLLWGEKVLIVECRGPAARRRFWIDPSRMAQVLRNLFENSPAACPAPARISLDFMPVVFDGRGAVRLAIRDNGPGLTEEQRGRVFTPFYTTKRHGTGLGLSIARRIVERHAGEMKLGDGTEGAEFVITLPRHPNRRARRTAAAGPHDDHAAPARDSNLARQTTLSDVALAPGAAIGG